MRGVSDILKQIPNPAPQLPPPRPLPLRPLPLAYDLLLEETETRYVVKPNAPSVGSSASHGELQTRSCKGLHRKREGQGE